MKQDKGDAQKEKPRNCDADKKESQSSRDLSWAPLIRGEKERLQKNREMHFYVSAFFLLEVYRGAFYVN